MRQADLNLKHVKEDKEANLTERQREDIERQNEALGKLLDKYNPDKRNKPA